MQYSMISESADLPVEDAAGDDVEPVHLELEIPALTVVAVDVDGTDLHGRIPKVV